MANKAKNKYSVEVDNFGLPPADPMSGMGGGMDQGMGMDPMGGGMDPMGGMGGQNNVSHASNGLFPQDIIPVRGAKRLWRLLGISFQSNRPKNEKENKVNLFAYNPNELKYQPGFMKDSISRVNSPASLYNYLQQTSQRAAAWERESKSTNILSPEIESAKDIMVASILSPIDLQTGAINVIVKDDSLPEETQTALSKVLSDYVNDELKLTRRLTKWIGNALYQTGATPILILPQSNVETLRNLNDMEYAGFLENKYGIKPTKRPDKTIVSGEALKVNPSGAKKIDYMASFESLSLDSVGTEDLNVFMEDTVNDCIASVEALDFIEKKEVDSLHKSKEQFKQELKDVIDKSKNFVLFSHDPGIINRRNVDIRSKLYEIQRNIDKEFVLNRADPIYILNTDQSKSKIEAASIVELPYQSVVPVIVPGAPRQHIGYFVIVNQWGEPINPDNRDMNDMNANSRLVESNMHARFGVPSALIVGDRSPLEHFKVTSSIFGTILRHMMERKLEEYGLGGTQIEQHEAITTCLIRNMLDSKRIGLIFIPEPMMVYYHFDVHQDGTGKSLIEDIRTLTGLRTTLVTANIMAATENSIDQKIVELDVGEMNANAQQLMDQIKNALTEKRVMRYDNNPLNVQRDLIQKSLTFVPKGLKGLQNGLNVQTQHRSAGVVGADENLLNQLNDWVLQGLKVPKNAVNKASDEDFARSVVTTNLFFNNRVKMYQQEVNEKTTKLVRNYVKYSTILKEKILDTLAVAEKDYSDTKQNEEEMQEPKLDLNLDSKEKSSTEAQALSEKQIDEAEKKAKEIRKKDTNPPKSDQEIKENKNSIYEQLQEVIDHIQVVLPEPRIVVDKAQTEEITSFAQCVQNVIDTVYSDELLPDDYSAYHNVLHMFRAREKARLIRDFIKKVGFNSVFDLPTLDQLSTTDLYDVAMFVINQKKGMDNIHEQIANKINLGNRVQNEGMVDTTGGMGMGGGMDMSGGMPSEGGGTLGGMPDVNADMNMNAGATGNGEAGATSTTETNAENPGNMEQELNEAGSMPDIKF